jgi:hypothetical protein
MVAAVYSVSADRLEEEAQRTLDTHVTSADGQCLGCGGPAPCWRREWAVSVYSRSQRLPRRRPGASQPELIRAGSAVSWFGQ